MLGCGLAAPVTFAWLDLPTDMFVDSVLSYFFHIGCRVLGVGRCFHSGDMVWPQMTWVREVCISLLEMPEDSDHLPYDTFIEVQSHNRGPCNTKLCEDGFRALRAKTEQSSNKSLSRLQRHPLGSQASRQSQFRVSCSGIVSKPASMAPGKHGVVFQMRSSLGMSLLREPTSFSRGASSQQGQPNVSCCVLFSRGFYRRSLTRWILIAFPIRSRFFRGLPRAGYIQTVACQTT